MKNTFSIWDEEGLKSYDVKDISIMITGTILADNGNTSLALEVLGELESIITQYGEVTEKDIQIRVIKGKKKK